MRKRVPKAGKRVRNISPPLLGVPQTLSINWVVVVHIFNPSTWEAEAGDLCELKAGVIWNRVSSRIASTTQRTLVSKKKKKQKQEKKKKKPKK